MRQDASYTGFALVPALLVTGCIAGFPGPFMSVPGETLADSGLQSDTWMLLVEVLDKGAAPDCDQREVVDTRVLEHPAGASVRDGPLLQGGWVEEWTLDRCGEQVAYRVEYVADGRGGTFVRARKPPQED